MGGVAGGSGFGGEVGGFSRGLSFGGSLRLAAYH